MLSKFNQEEREQLIMVYALLCSDQDASIKFLDSVGSGLGSKTETELRDHYHKCFTDLLLRVDRKKSGIIS